MEHDLLSDEQKRRFGFGVSLSRSTIREESTQYYIVLKPIKWKIFLFLTTMKKSALLLGEIQLLATQQLSQEDNVNSL